MKRIYFILISIIATTSVAWGQGSPNDLPTDITNVTQTVSPTTAKNYILSYSYLKEFAIHPSNLLTGDANPEIQYFDGLGRPVQSVSVKATTLGKDFITYQAYDDYGRIGKSYLPYAKSSNNGAYVDESSFISQQNTFLSGIYGSTDGNKGYSEAEYENCPLNRVLKQGAPGDSWQKTANPVEYAYKINPSTVQSWKYSGDSYSSISYAAGKLFLKETTDEDNKVVKEYTNTEGKIIQKEVDGALTRYCYDEFGLLRCVVQPTGTSPASTGLCFYYKYDGKQRLIEKRFPIGYSGTTVYYIYDSLNRLVLLQDANQRAKSTPEWTYNVYDDFNHLTETGTWATTISRSTLETTMASAANLDYIENITSKVPLKYLHYNNYTNLPSANAFYTSDATTLGVSAATSNIDRLTWAESKAMDYETGMDYWITSAFYYDKYGRLIQTVVDNHLGGTDYITNKYNFTGQIIRTYHRHTADGTTTTLDQYSDYDHRGRLMKTRYKINGGTELLLSANNYDETGQLVDKYLHSESGGNFLQRMDYEYNIRGWLTKINDPVTFTENDKLGIQLYYNTAPTGGTALYNGNISGMKWGAPTYNDMLYRFSYDNKNRLNNADFYKSGYSSTAFDTGYTYDSNGNLLTLERYGSAGTLIDDLEYSNVGNSIITIEDYAFDIPNTVDYPGYDNRDSYNIDMNGNLNYECTKEITIDYNLLNLPQELNFGSNRKINYFYSIDGIKLRKTVEDNGTITKTDYCGPFVYETISGVRSLKYFVTSEGRAVKNGSSWEYEYNLKDHLGNTRTVIKNNSGVAQVIQERHYYPFGMEMSGLSSGTGTNKYLYNSKEHQNDFELDWYDYGARFYDPALGRFHTLDRFLEKYYNISGYVYVANNPMINIDFNGDSIIKVSINDKSGFIKGSSNLYIDHAIYDDVKSILEYVAENEIPIHINSSFRTNKRQGGLTSENSITPAKKSLSPHNAGLAIDFNLYKNDKINDGIDSGNSTVTANHNFIKKIKGKNWRWGGDFKDPDKIHMDKRGADSNFETIRDANQKQMHGDTELETTDSYVKRKETITVNKKDERL